ncbi:MAG: helix-turn-helix transcriptional regulator [Pseudomonadota bacterium]
MSYAIEHIGKTLRDAREARELSQRALSAMAGVPQSHISKIENGAVDLRVSSLVALARVLDLELVLVPRKATPAVQSIARSSAAPMKVAAEGAGQALKELKRMQNEVAQLAKVHPNLTELAQIQQRVRELQHVGIPRHGLEALRNVSNTLKAFKKHQTSVNAVLDALAQINKLRNEIAHSLDASSSMKAVRSAYSLDEDDHG